MFCSNCGTQLPDNSNFCNECGALQKSATEINSNKIEWEVCKVDVENVSSFINIMFSEAPIIDLFVKPSLIFKAEAIGPNGVYIVAKSEQFKDTNKERKRVRDAFLARLVNDGWEPVPNSSPYNLQFRRRAK